MFRLYPEAPHTGVTLAISNISTASRHGVEIRPDALREAARQLNELADTYEAESAKVAA